VAGKLGAAFLCLVFAIPFGGVGVYASWAIGSTLTEAWRARDWVKVRATVGEATLHSGGDTFRAEGTYRYTFEGREYTGNRLGLSKLGGADNIDDWHQEVSDRLRQARESRKPVSVWVNPDNPTDAVYDREIRWSEVLFLTPFALAFGGVGVGALIAMVVVLRGKAPAKAGRSESEEGNVVSLASKDDAGKTAGFLWVFAFFWNAMSWPIAFLAVPEIVAEGEWAGLLVLLFPLVGLGLLWGAVAASWNAWKARKARRGGASAEAVAALAFPPVRSLPGTMAAKAARAMFNPGEGPARGGFGRRSTGAPVREPDIPASLATVEEAGGALTLRYSMRRWLVPSIILFVVGGVFSTIGAVLLAQEGFGFAPLLLFVLGTAIDVGAVALLVSRLEVTVREGRLDVTKRGLFGARSWILAREEVTELRPTISHRINEYPYYALNAVTAAGDRVPVGSSIRGPELTDSLARRIARAFGMPASGIVPAGTVTESQ
jgi:hypothetical protein